MDNKEIIKKLKEYQTICNEAIAEAQKIKFKGAINWSDLSCVLVVFCLPSDGGNFYKFFISEASPNCGEEFTNFIQMYLIDKVDLYPEIITEW